jgi:transposase InsO family protein
VPLKHKNKAEEAIKEFISKIKAKGQRTEAIWKDGGTEFSSKKFEKWLKEKGIQIEDSALYTLEQNSLSERSVGLVCAKARSILLATDLPQSIWAEAILTATYLINRSPTRSLERGQTLYKAFHGKKPSILYI